LIGEEELIQLCKKKDQNAQKMLFEKYANQMMAVCYRYCKNEEDARDLLHDGFYKVFTKIDSFKGGSKISTWMTRVFINLALNKLRQGRNKYWHDEFETRHSATVEMETEETTTEVDSKTVMEALKSLPEKYRVVINMYAIDNLSHKEISKQLGITEGSSKSRLSRARVMLNAQLKRT
jgi:RNA polymerase sigma-70 factor (ECF subfamily)